MPKDTFQKIDPDKRERLLREAARLFAERGFNQTDVAELAHRAGIAKGSIYNYFDNKEDLYLYVCRDGIERSRRAVYGEVDFAWDIYRQVEHIFIKGAQFVRDYPEYLILYSNISSAGMERFSAQMSLEVEKYTADRLKKIIRRDMRQGIVRKDLDVNLTAFLINSIYIILMTSLISGHYQIRMQEYLEIAGDLDEKAIQKHLRRTIDMIGSVLRPIGEA